MPSLSTKTFQLSSWGIALVFLVQGALSGNPLDCSNVTPKSVDEIRQDPSFGLLDNPSGANEQSIKRLLDSYTCNIIKRSALWESMFDRETVVLFEAIYTIVENGHNLYDIVDLDMRNFIILELVQRMLSTYKTPQIVQSFAMFSGLTEVQAIDAMESTCGKIDAQFGPFYKDILGLQALSKNDRLIQKLVGYDELFMKLVVVYSTCIQMYNR